MSGRQREFAPLPRGVVRVRLEGESGRDLTALLAALPGVAIVTGPDAYPGSRLYLTVAILGDGQAGAAALGSGGGTAAGRPGERS